MLYNHANFYRFEETSSYCLLKEYQFFSALHWSTSVTPAASQCITVTKIENAVPAVHSCNSRFLEYCICFLFVAQKRCPIGARFRKCSNPCPKTCENYNKIQPCLKPCIPGCQCKSGWVIHEGRCIKPKECPAR